MGDFKKYLVENSERVIDGTKGEEPIEVKGIDIKKARELAGEFHGGMMSALYSFASTGKLFYPASRYIKELSVFPDDKEAMVLIKFFNHQKD